MTWTKDGYQLDWTEMEAMDPAFNDCADGKDFNLGWNVLSERFGWLNCIMNQYFPLRPNFI